VHSSHSSNLGIQLRTHGLGSVSGALSHCLAAGLPTVANAGLAEAIGVPPEYTRTTPDALSPLLLAEALADLLAAESGQAAAERREAARKDYSKERSFAVYAEGLCRALELDVASSHAASTKGAV
jgi:hypothetical protein